MFAQDQSLVESLETELFLEKDTQKKIDVLIELTELLSSSDPDKALDFAKQTHELSQQNSDSESELKVYLQMCEIYRHKTDFRNSIQIGNMAKSLASDLGMDKEYAKSLNLIALNFSKLATLYKKKASFDQSLYFFKKTSLGELYP